MFKAEKMRACAPLLAFLSAFFFAQQAIAADQIKTPTPTPLPNAVAAAPVHPAVNAPAPAPAPTQLDRPQVTYKPSAYKPTTDKPTTDNSSNTLTNLPASKRLAISVLAGVLTLIAALWIGARRD